MCVIYCVECYIYVWPYMLQQLQNNYEQLQNNYTRLQSQKKESDEKLEQLQDDNDTLVCENYHYLYHQI